VALITPCVYLLGTGKLQNQSLIVYTGSVNASTCPIDTNTLLVESSGQVAVEALNVAGPPGTSSVAGYAYPPPQYNVPALSDPLAAVVSPSFSGTCNHTSYSVTSGTVALSPGTYCKGLNIANATVTLSAGLYVITGGGIWNHSTVTGTGVTLFFTTGGGASYGQFIVENSSTLNLTAPLDASNGGTPTISIFVDRNWVHTGGQDFQLASTTFSGDGIWYMPAAGLELYSCGTVVGTHYLGVVADNIFTAGTIFTPTNNYSYLHTGNPFRTQGALVQ
jgi:hypothetical protein